MEFQDEFSETVPWHCPYLPEDIHHSASSQADCSNLHQGLVALTPVTMKCLERLVLQYIKTALQHTLDLQQYTYTIYPTDQQTMPFLLPSTLYCFTWNSVERMHGSCLWITTLLFCKLFSKMSNLGLQYSIYLCIQGILTNKVTVSQDGPPLLLDFITQPRSSTRLCVEPFAIVAVHI